MSEPSAKKKLAICEPLEFPTFAVKSFCRSKKISKKTEGKVKLTTRKDLCSSMQPTFLGTMSCTHLFMIAGGVF
jgi:hypothetical protein